MVLIPQLKDPTLEALDAVLIDEFSKEPQRDYLGASSIGEACARRTWYRYHGDREIFDVDSIRRFIDGHRTEDLVISWLRKLPFLEIHTHDESGNQYGFTDGKFSGHYDGVIRGIIQAPKTWHILEVKCVNEKKFTELNKLKRINEKSALEEWSKTYYAQAVIYMDKAGLTRHYLVCATPGGRQLTSIRTDCNPEYAAQLTDKAHKIISATSPPPRISEKSDFFECAWCSFKDICHA